MRIAWLIPCLVLSSPAPPMLGDPLPGAAQTPYAEVSLLHASSSRNLESGETQRTFIVQADLTIPDGADAVGMSHQIELTELRDDAGEDLLLAWRRSGQLIFGGPRNYGSLARHRATGQGGSISLSTSINALPYIPSSFQTVRGKAFVLLATRRVRREVAPLSSGTLVELTPSLAVQIVGIQREGGSLQVQFTFDAAQPSPFFNANAAPPFVDAVVLVDDAGNEIGGHGGAPQPEEPKRGVFEGQGQLAFNLPEGRSPASLRFDIVLDTREQEVEFIARDVPMPVGASR